MAESVKRSGNISVETQNIFPVIKKWLYSEIMEILPINVTNMR